MRMHDLEMLASLLRPNTHWNPKSLSDDFDKKCQLRNRNVDFFRKNIAQKVFSGQIPLNLFEEEDYLRFLKHLMPELDKFSVDTIRGDCLQPYNDKREDLKNRLQSDMVSRICLMVDIWKSEESATIFMCPSARCISSHHHYDSLFEVVLDVYQLSSPLNQDELTDAILLSLSEWDIEENVSSFTFRNCPTYESPIYDSVVARVKDHLQKKNTLLLDGRLFHIRCSREVLNLMVQQGMNAVLDIVHKLPITESPLCDDEQWDSSYKMLEEALQLKKAFQMSHGEGPTVDEWKKVEGVYLLVQLIKNLADACSSRYNYFRQSDHVSYPTVFFHKYWQFHKCLVAESMSSDSFVSEVANKMLQLFDKYWDEVFFVLAMVTVMDPQFKMKYLEFFFTEFSGSAPKTSLEVISKAISDVYHNYASDHHSISDVSGDEKDYIFVTHEDLKVNTQSELDQYLDKPVFTQGLPSVDVFSWWRSAIDATKGGYYSALSMMAYDILAIGFSIFTPKSHTCLQYETEKNSLDPALSKASFLMKCWSKSETWLKSELKVSSGGRYKQDYYNFEHADDDQRYFSGFGEKEDHGKKLADMIYRNCLPLHLVENESFMALVEPDFKKVNMEAVKSHILVSYKKWKRNVKRFLLGKHRHHSRRSETSVLSVPGGISLAVDKWRSTDGLEFLCITAYFIDSNWDLRKLVLSFFQVPIPLTEDMLTAEILKCISKWGIDRKIFSITLRNSSIYDLASTSLKNLLHEKNRLPLNGMIFSVRCCSDIFSQMVQEGLNEVLEIVGKVGEILCSHSSEQLQHSKQWDMTYLMLRKALEMKETCPTSAICSNEILSVDEWENVKGICKLLEIFYDVARVLTSTKCKAANIYFHNIWVVRTRLTQESVSSDSFVSNVAKKMLGKFDKYWNDMFLVMAIASVMDPSFRMDNLEYVLSNCEDIDSNALITLVRESVSGLFNKYAAHPTSTIQPQCKTTTGDKTKVPDALVTGDNTKVPDALLKAYHDFVLSHVSKSELDQYLEDWPVPVPKLDVLQWWRAYGDKYPTLSRMAYDILAIPMSVMTDECSTFQRGDAPMFTMYGRELDPYLSSLEPDILEALFCMNQWRRF